MSNLYTFPSVEMVEKIVSSVPEYMGINKTPYAVINEGYLSPATCDALIEQMSSEDPYEFHGCNAVTREASHPMSTELSKIHEWTMVVNRNVWQFDLHGRWGAWFQTYESGGNYQLHADAALGQTRKLTTVALLSDPKDYSGGELKLVPYPERHIVPRTRGTVVTFPGWMLHEVLLVTEGIRQTINFGVWGPPFR